MPPDPSCESVTTVVDKCYHGTDEQSEAAIDAQGFKLPEPDASSRYGRGIYFWKGSLENAKWWLESREIRKGAVFEAKVHLGKHLDLLTEEGRSHLVTIANNLRKSRAGRDLSEFSEAAVLSFMAQKKWIETSQILDLGPLPREIKSIMPGVHKWFSPSNARLIICVYRLENILAVAKIFQHPQAPAS